MSLSNELLLSIPNGFELFGRKIYFYGIISAFAYLIGVLLACKNAKKRGLKTEDIITLACYLIPLCIVGARIYYVLFSLDKYTNFWDVFKIWEGGLAFYGGLIGGAVGVVLYCVIHKKNFLAICDIIAPGVILAQALGRWGNFFNQEAFGLPVTDKSLQWFPYAVFIDGDGWHMATFFYESFWNLIGYAILQLLLNKAKFKENGMIAAGYFLIYGLGRVWIEGLRTDSLFWGPIRVSQALSGVFVLLGAAYVIYYVVKYKSYKWMWSFCKETYISFSRNFSKLFVEKCQPRDFLDAQNSFITHFAKRIAIKEKEQNAKIKANKDYQTESKKND